MLPVAVQHIGMCLERNRPPLQSILLSFHIQISRANLGRPIRSYRCIRTNTPTIMPQTSNAFIDKVEGERCGVSVEGRLDQFKYRCCSYSP